MAKSQNQFLNLFVYIKRTKICFAISIATLFWFPILFPKWHLLYFAPFLVTCFYQHTRSAVLWRACLCGVIIDLLSSSPVFGITPINYCLVSFLLFGQVRNFFEDHLSTLPIMTFLFSFLSTLLTLFCNLFSGLTYPLSLTWIATDLLIMPAADALFALLLFSLPFKLIKRRGYREEKTR